MTMRDFDHNEEDRADNADGGVPRPRSRAPRKGRAAALPETRSPGEEPASGEEGPAVAPKKAQHPARKPRARRAAATAVASDALDLRLQPDVATVDAPPAGARAGEERPARSAPPALSVARLSFTYRDRKVLDDISFRVERGVFTALLGPNGAGKTTLFSLITRLFDSGDGAIEILGRDPKRDGARALAPLGVVFQRETLDLDLTVRQNLTYFAGLHGLRSREARLRMEEELAAIDVLDKIDVRVRDLNGGHRRRVEIARALLHRPELLLLDEATVGLDVPSRRAIVTRVHSLAVDRGIGVLWTTHLIDEVFDDDALLVLHRGRIVASGRVATVVAARGRSSLGEAFDEMTGRSKALPDLTESSGR